LIVSHFQPSQLKLNHLITALNQNRPYLLLMHINSLVANQAS